MCFSVTLFNFYCGSSSRTVSCLQGLNKVFLFFLSLLSLISVSLQRPPVLTDIQWTASAGPPGSKGSIVGGNFWHAPSATVHRRSVAQEPWFVSLFRRLQDVNAFQFRFQNCYEILYGWSCEWLCWLHRVNGVVNGCVGYTEWMALWMAVLVTQSEWSCEWLCWLHRVNGVVNGCVGLLTGGMTYE